MELISSYAISRIVTDIYVCLQFNLIPVLSVNETLSTANRGVISTRGGDNKNYKNFYYESSFVTDNFSAALYRPKPKATPNAVDKMFIHIFLFESFILQKILH